jgi:hypothetical protein
LEDERDRWDKKEDTNYFRIHYRNENEAKDLAEDVVVDA